MPTSLFLRSSWGRLAWAIFDNGVHAACAAVLWLIYEVELQQHTVWRALPNAAIALLCASLVDLDHFVAASSLSLQVAS